MKQNPDYFQGYYTEGRKVDVQTMDRMLLERGSAWIVATDRVTQEAALYEYIDTVIGLIELDGTNPTHRHDVQEQALSTINVLVNALPMRSSRFSYRETRMNRKEEFLKGMMVRMFDRQYENSFATPNSDIQNRRIELRDKFQVVLDVDPSIFPQQSGQAELPAPQASAESNDAMNREATHIHIEFPNGQGRMFGEALAKMARRRHWNIISVYYQGEGKNTLEIYPRNLGNIQRKANPHDTLRAALQPVEDYLAEKGYTAGPVTTDISKGNIVEWQLKEAE